MGCGDTCPFYPGNATKIGYSKTQPATESTPYDRSAEIRRRVENLTSELVPTKAR
jgi:hypothetical protein